MNTSLRKREHGRCPSLEEAATNVAANHVFVIGVGRLEWFVGQVERLAVDVDELRTLARERAEATFAKLAATGYWERAAQEDASPGQATPMTVDELMSRLDG